MDAPVFLRGGGGGVHTQAIWMPRYLMIILFFNTAYNKLLLYKHQ